MNRLSCLCRWMLSTNPCTDCADRPTCLDPTNTSASFFSCCLQCRCTHVLGANFPRASGKHEQVSAGCGSTRAMAPTACYLRPSSSHSTRFLDAVDGPSTLHRFLLLLHALPHLNPKVPKLFPERCVCCLARLPACLPAQPNSLSARRRPFRCRVSGDRRGEAKL